MEQGFSFIKLQTRWEKTVFYGSIAGSIIVLILTFVKYERCSMLTKENEMLRKENVQLHEEIVTLKKN